MIIESGIIIFFGLWFIAMKLSKRSLLRILGRPVALDIGVTALVLVLHWGTFSGVMAASFAGLMTSVWSSLARKYYGYIQQGRYFPGIVRFDPKELK